MQLGQCVLELLLGAVSGSSEKGAPLIPFALPDLLPLPWQLLSLLSCLRFSPLRSKPLDVLARALAEGHSQAGGGGLEAGDVVVSSADARSGVGLLRRSDERGLFYRQVGRGLLQHDISRCCFLGTTSFGTGRYAMSAALSAFFFGIWDKIRRKMSFAEKGCRGLGPALTSSESAGAPMASLGSFEGLPRPEARRGRQR
jgi:hypothetical protein